MSETPSIREGIRAEIAGLGLGLREGQALERALIKVVVARLAIDGYKISPLAVLVGIPHTTIRSWRDKDPAFAAQLEAASSTGRTRLLGVLWGKAEDMGPVVPGVGQAINALSHLLLPELRSSVVENVHTTPDPDEANAKLLALVRKGEDKTPDAI